jgi:hypothetical protein
MYLVESAAPFSRSDADITAHVGYAGGFAEGPGGLVRHQPAALSTSIILVRVQLITDFFGQVCYHGGPRGTLYSDMGHGEATEVMLDRSFAFTVASTLVLRAKNKFSMASSCLNRMFA